LSEAREQDATIAVFADVYIGSLIEGRVFGKEQVTELLVVDLANQRRLSCMELCIVTST
jgi:hypothetical protein